MATSGRINSGGGNSTYFYFQWQLAGQDVGGNYSVINWQAGINISGGAYWLSNAVKIYGTYINGGGNVGSGTWSNQSGNGDHQLLSGSYTIGHNGDGTKNFGASINGWLYGYGDYGTSGSWDLPQIPRYANITGFYTSEVTDVGFKINTVVDATCNFLQYSLEDGVGWRDQYGGSFGSYGFTVGGAFPSNTNYNLRVRVRRQDSGLWTESGVISVQTLAQARSFDTMGV